MPEWGHAPPQLAERLELDLTDPFAGQIELAADLLERPRR
jgi:hypothetical protein